MTKIDWQSISFEDDCVFGWSTGRLYSTVMDQRSNWCHSSFDVWCGPSIWSILFHLILSDSPVSSLFMGINQREASLAVKKQGLFTYFVDNWWIILFIFF